MDYIKKFKLQVAIRASLSILLVMVTTLTTLIFSAEVMNMSTASSYLIAALAGLVVLGVVTNILARMSIEPVRMLESVISYATHDNRSTGAPNIEKLRLGRELITAQSLVIYDLASRKTDSKQAADSTLQTTVSPPSNALDSVPVPLIGTDASQNITFANHSAIKFIGLELDAVVGKPLYDVLNLSFQNDKGLENWIKEIQDSSVTATKSWERVRMNVPDGSVKQFDLVAGYSKNNSSGTDIVLSVFDRTDKYNQDDKELSYVALAVHELRTPLTLLRGYIEVFEDEIGPQLSPELADFMHRMHASSQQLTSFVSNILNVARIEENQLALKLSSENWASVLQIAISDLEMRAKVYGKHIELQVADGLPAVAVDRVSINEVINNLVENAIKYSADSDKIVITSALNSDGMVQTSVQDFGIGIPESVMGELFQKFHRSHRSRAKIGGTGLGLYLCKALVNAHGGNIWVQSKEGEGSVFTFTLVPYDKLSKEQVAGEDGIIRGAHGWIKNHSLYRN